MMSLNSMTMNGQLIANTNNALPPVSLGRLIDFSIQRTYHELTVLADLLPRKTDMERKIEIVSFANRTRQLFIRLLALVKWAGSASKVEKCASIVSFLDKQSLLFIETADVLAKMSRETLVNARLPSFQLPCAVEVLTLGTYSRLPSCIRDRIVPPDPITSLEKRSTLLRLNQIIQQRLVTSFLPSQMKSLKIEYGRVTFHVDYEFELSLTLLGDSPSIPWRVLNIEILVEDKETGGGKDLVHPLQIIFLQHLVQSRLTDTVRPLVDAYNCLHSFCLSLQLEVLHAQAIRLSQDRLGDFIRIDEYTPGCRLQVSYWRDQPRDDKFGYKLCVEIDSAEPSRPLQVSHLPELESKDTFERYQAIKSDHFSIEKILIHTTHERAKQKLNQLKKEFHAKNVGKCHISGSPAVLQIEFLHPCMTSEQLLISVDSLTGHFLAQIPQFDECPIVDEIGSALNKDYSKVIDYFSALRIWVTRERCKKTVESLPVFASETLNFPPAYDHPFASSKESKLFYQFSKHHQYYLVTLLKESNDVQVNINIEYSLICVEPTFSTSVDQNFSIEIQKELPKSFVNIIKTFELDVSNILFKKSTDDFIERNGKRKLSDQNESLKHSRNSGYYIPELAHVVSFCEEKLAYSSLSIELQKRSICHQVLQDTEGFTHVIDIVRFPKCLWCPESFTSNLQSDTLSCAIRLQGKGSKIWNVTFAFCNPPLQSQTSREHGLRRLVNLVYDFSNDSQTQIVKMVDELLQDWTAVARLYDVVKRFSLVLHSNNQMFQSIVDIKSFSYRKLVLGYGTNKCYTISIYWKSSEKRFQLFFGVIDTAVSGTNPHGIVATQLQHEFNQHQSIAHLIQVLHFTLNPLNTIQNLSGITLLGVINSRPHVPVQSFTIIPQSSTHMRLVYRNLYCLDITMQPDGEVAIRDGAISLFDKSKAVDELTPIPGLKAFLNKFVDKTTQMRRLSQTEDDNPPSPVSQFDAVESYLFAASQMKTASPSKSLHMEGRGLPHQITSSQGSNPHTPTSPHTSVLTQSGYSSSPGTFPLSSPPSHTIQGHNVTSNQIAPSPSMAVPEQSPGNLFGVSSPINPLHAPSPSFLPTPSPSSQFHTHSPASQFMQSTAQGTHDITGVGSPFTTPNVPSNLSMPSPVPNVWPGSPSIPRPSPRSLGSTQSPVQSHMLQTNSPQPGSSGQLHPSGVMHNPSGTVGTPTASARLLPQRPWAAAIPTRLPHHGFDLMCRQNAMLINDNIMSQGFSNAVYDSLSQLERFLGCVFMRRNLHRVIQGDESFTLHHTTEPGIIQFKNEAMQFKISLHPLTMQSLHLKILPQPEFNQWSREELELLQQFFESKVVCAPYKPNAFLAYIRILNAPLRILKDCIQLMKLEMFPDRNLRWSIHWCLTIPPSAPPIAGGTPPPPGMSAFIMNRNKILIFIQFNRINIGHPIPPEPHSIIVPLIYDMSTNSLQVTGDRSGDRSTYINLSAPLTIINSLLRRFAEYPSDQCLLFPAIRDLMANFQLS